MPKQEIKHVKDLTIDRKNFRTPPQSTENAALKAMLAVNPSKFWALMESLLDDGYHLTENILVLMSNGAGSDLIVKEGNQRIAAIKLALGFIKPHGLDIPDEIQAKIKGLSDEIKAALEKVPCAVYDADESDTVDRIVSLTHGKGQKASRTAWTAVAKARHTREKLNGSEPGLDMLEKYLKEGDNLTNEEKALWGGNYPLSVLDEALGKIAPRLGFDDARKLIDAYPSDLAKAAHRTGLEQLLHDIGVERLGFPEIRDPVTDFGAKYGFKAPKDEDKKDDGASSKSGGSSTTKPKKKSSSKRRALSLRDPKSVMRRLGEMVVRGTNRDKVETLRHEALWMNLNRTPMAFCFLLRSMFEISAKAYCHDHAADGLSTTKNGKEKTLAQLLDGISKHLTKADPAMTKTLHGAMAELAQSSSLLSVTSMNQLVHSEEFSVKAADISTLFHRVAPLLEAMNA